MAKDVVDMSVFFTTERERDGVWFEPVVKAHGVGYEFKVIGATSDEAAEIFAEYDKAMGSISDDDSLDKKNATAREIISSHAARLVKDVRSTNGKPLVVGDKEFEFSVEAVKDVLMNTPRFALQIIDFSRRDTNFMGKKDL